VHDVALSHIRSVISQKFDARKVDAVFEEEGGVPLAEISVEDADDGCSERRWAGWRR
jgi:hypothetical protein